MRTTVLLLAFGAGLLACKSEPKTFANEGDDDDDGTISLTGSTEFTPETSVVECGATYPTPDVTGVCLTEVLDCDVTIEATTVGGSTHYNLPLWEDAQCADWLLGGPDDSLDAAERVYELNVPDGMFANVTMWPCENLELRARNGATECSDSPTACRGSRGTWKEQDLSSLPGNTRWEIIVDGFDGASGNFVLEVDCFE
jgi:hypothetical protein